MKDKKENINEINKKFLEIKEKGWIKSDFDAISGVGLVFEKEIGIKQNNSPIADYKGIEIKCKRKHSSKSIRLFSASFENNKKIHEKYGKLLMQNSAYIYYYISGKYYNNINNHYSLKLNVDYKNEKIFLQINKDGILIDSQSYWSFNLLKEKIYQKLLTVAYIKADSKKINNDYYYKYENISFYSLKSFKKFLYLIDNGYIYVKFQISKYNYGDRKGQIHDHGISFYIREDKLNYLFYKIYI